MKYESLLFKGHPNLRAKLRNSMADLRWYAFRFAEFYGIRGATPKTVFEIISQVAEINLPSELRLILVWRSMLEAATPEEADGLFHDCWRFVHNFDEKLSPCLSEHKTN